MDLSQQLNRHCYCVGTNVPALQNALDTGLRGLGLSESMASSRPHLFSSLPVFISERDRVAMQTLIHAIESVVAMPAYREHVLRDAPAVARLNQASRGAFLGYDFHLAEDGPKLIEINTNPGGSLLNAEMIKLQQPCCDAVTHRVGTLSTGDETERAMLDVLQSEWRLARGSRPLKTVAIVDTDPTSQYLYPEFLLFKRQLEKHGIEVFVVAPGDLAYADGALAYGAKSIDLVYNRLTDFYLVDDTSRALREAYLSDAAVITPHPAAHALYANKLNLAVLTNRELLRSLQVPDDTIERLLQGIPRTVAIDTHDKDHWWSERKQWFFKPATGFGSRGTYRGDKVTRKVFEEIIHGDYVAQAFSPPSERHQADNAPLKFDVRCYAYNGNISLIAARLYQGQTTNFRTPGGGFAPIYSLLSNERTA